jgi:hypothetical protein
MTDLNTRLHDMVTAGRILTIAGLAATVAIVGACDRRTPSGKAVSQSARELHTVMSPASSTSAEGGGTYAKTTYEEVVKTVADSGKDGLPGEVAAAHLLAAESQLGLTEQPVATATSLEAAVDSESLIMRGFLAAWISENARADAAALYNPAESISAAEKAAADFDTKAAESTSRRDQLAAQIKDLESQAGDRLDKVREEETAISQMRDQAATVKATEAAKIIEQASERRRASDKVRTEGALLQAQAEQLQPQFREAELMLAQYQAQAKTYRDSIADMRRQEGVKKEESSAARSAAGAAAQELDSRITEIAKTRGEALSQAYDAASSAFQKALSTVKEARADQSFALAKVSEGNIQQSIGDLHWARAQGLFRFGATLERLGDVKPALPNASSYSQQAKASKEAAVEALSTAQQAYEAASSAFGGAQVRGQAKERLSLLSGKLDAVARITSGQGLDALAALANGTFKPSDAPQEDPAPTPDQPVEEGPAAPVDATDGAGAFLDQFLDSIRAGDAQALSASIHADNNALRSLASEQVRMIGLLAKLESASKEKFNASFIEKLASMAQGSGAMSGVNPSEIGRLAEAKSQDLNIKVEGDAGTFSLPGSPQELNLIRVDGQWKMAVPAVPAEMTPELIASSAGQIAMINNALSSLSDDINAGTIDNIDSAVAALQMKIMAGFPTGNNGGPGGGG